MADAIAVETTWWKTAHAGSAGVVKLMRWTDDRLRSAALGGGKHAVVAGVEKV